MRCVDRFIHLAAILTLRVLGPDVHDESKQLNLLNRTLAPVMGKVTGKNRTAFVAPSSRSGLWKLNQINGAAYKKLLNGFKFKSVPGLVAADRDDIHHTYQSAWDEFAELYARINRNGAMKPSEQRSLKNAIEAWFFKHVNDYLQSDESAKKPTPRNVRNS